MSENFNDQSIPLADRIAQARQQERCTYPVMQFALGAGPTGKYRVCGDYDAIYWPGAFNVYRCAYHSHVSGLDQEL